MASINIDNSERIASIGSLFLRLGLAYIFLWPAINRLVLDSPPPIFLADILSKFPILAWTLPLPLGILQMVIGGLLIIGLFTRTAATIQAIMFLLFIIATIIAVPQGFSIVWKDIALFLSSVSLAFIGCRMWGIDMFLKGE